MVPVYAALYIFDGGPLSPIYPQSILEVSDITHDYVSHIGQKIMESDNCKSGRINSNDDLFNALLLFKDQDKFLEASHKLVDGLNNKLAALNVSREGFDLLVFTFNEQESLHLCIAYLPYRSSYIHIVSNENNLMQTNIVQHKYILPPPSSQTLYGVVANLQSNTLAINDAKVLTTEGHKQLFSEILFKCESSLSQKELVKSVEDLAQRIQPSLAEDNGKRKIRQAMAKSVEATGSIDIEVVAEQLFANSQENFDAFTKEAENCGANHQIPIQSKKVIRSLEKVKIVTDNGVSILLPQRVANDSESFLISNNQDGSISITIRNILKMKTQ